MTVWQDARGTMGQFAKAIATERGEHDAIENYDRLLRAMWLGRFEGQVCFPRSAVGIELRASGTWQLKRIEDEEGKVWTGDIATHQPCPFDPFTRADLRVAVWSFSELSDELRDLYPIDVQDADGASENRHPADRVSFDVLAGYRAHDYGDDFRKTYLDQLYIETAAVTRWRAQVLPFVDGLIAALPTKRGLAVAAILEEWGGVPPSSVLGVEERNSRINTRLRAKITPPVKGNVVSDETITAAIEVLKDWIAKGLIKN